jgi:hypothetical protein
MPCDNINPLILCRRRARHGGPGSHTISDIFLRIPHAPSPVKTYYINIRFTPDTPDRTVVFGILFFMFAVKHQPLASQTFFDASSWH